MALNCKCCSKSIKLNLKFQYIFDKNGKKLGIRDLIFDCIGKRIEENEVTSQIICDPCFKQLLQIKEFKEKCFSVPEDDSNQQNEETPLKIEKQTFKPTSILNDSDKSLQYSENFKPETKIKCEIINFQCKVPLNLEQKNIFSEDSEFLKIPEPQLIVPIKKKTEISIVKKSVEEKCIENNPNEYEDIEYLQSDVSNIIFPDEDINAYTYLKNVELETLKAKGDFVGFIDQFYCSLCSLSFSPHLKFIDHILVKHSNYICDDQLYYQCTVDEKCERFHLISELNDHMLEYHYHIYCLSNAELLCLTCKSFFPTKIQFGKHSCTKVELKRSIEYNCSVCSKKFISHKRMIFHLQFHLCNPRPKICLICLLKFNDESEFYNHVEFSHENSHSIRNLNHQCKNCNLQFESMRLLNVHNEINHTANNGKKSFQCHICNKTINRISRLRKHIMLHQQLVLKDVIVCDLCDMAFYNEEMCELHFKKEHFEKFNSSDVNCGEYKYSKHLVDRVYCCEYCEKAFKSTDALLIHRNIHNNTKNPFQCEFCSSNYDLYSKLKTHRNSHRAQQNAHLFPVQRHYLCHFNNCLKSYMHWPDLNGHMKTTHPASGTIYSCNICLKEFSNGWNLTYHKKTDHTTIKLISCDKCDLKFKHKRDLKKHDTKNHSIKETTYCKKCKANFETVESLKIHNCKILCPICEKELSGNTLKVHMRVVHERVINYYCNICNKGFYNLTDKNCHIRVHTKEKPYKCETCPYRFRTKSMLVEHTRIHVNDRPFVCPYPKCGSSFRRSYAMKIHFKIHTGEKNFFCKYENCPKSYRNLSQLNSHVKIKHINSKKKLIDKPIKIRKIANQNDKIKIIGNLNNDECHDEDNNDDENIFNDDCEVEEQINYQIVDSSTIYNSNTQLNNTINECVIVETPIEYFTIDDTQNQIILDSTNTPNLIISTGDSIDCENDEMLDLVIDDEHILTTTTTNDSCNNINNFIILKRNDPIMDRFNNDNNKIIYFTKN